MSDSLRILQLAALLHDVGELVARASSAASSSITPAQLGAAWLRTFCRDGLPEAVVELAAAVAAPDSEERRGDKAVRALYHAERLLAQPAADAALDSPPPLWLPPVFAPESDLAFPAAHGAALPYPEADPPRPEFTELVAAFGQAFRRWAREGARADALVDLLERAWGYLPAPPRGDPARAGVSLFDAARVKCALAAALYFAPIDDLLREALPDDQPYFRLVAGRLLDADDVLERWADRLDLAAAAGKAFALRVFMEHAADEILARVGLCSACALWRSDAEFVLLCPNAAELDQAVEGLTDGAAEWLWTRCSVGARFALASAPLPPSGLRGDGLRRALHALDQQLELNACQPRGERLARAFKPREAGNPEAACETCGRDFDPALAPLSQAAPDVKACQTCRDFSELGAALLNTAGLAARPLASDSRRPLCLPRPDGSWLEYEIVSHEVPPGAARRRYALAHASADAERVLPAAPRAPALSRPGRSPEGKPKRDLASLRALAKGARGAARLAWLRFDVDGAQARVWFEQPTLLRAAAAARALSRFFETYAPAACEGRLPPGAQPVDLSRKRPRQAGGRRAAIVRSAGDDLLIVGAWDEVAEIAFDLSAAFRAYTADPSLTCSAAVVVDACEASWARAAGRAGDALALAKAAGGGRIALFPAPPVGRRRGEAEAAGLPWRRAEAEILQPLAELVRAGRAGPGRFEAPLPPAALGRMLALLDADDAAAARPRLAAAFYAAAGRRRNELPALRKLLADPRHWPALRVALRWLQGLSFHP